MDFYYITYTKQYYDNDDNIWRDTSYDNQQLIVIANNITEADFKIKQALIKLNNNEYRAAPNHEVRACIGLNLVHGFDCSFTAQAIE